MKLSMETYWLREKYGDKTAVKMLKDAGFDAIDYSLYWTNKNTDMIGDDYKEKAEDLRKYLDETGIECTQAHAPFDLKYENKLDMSDNTYKRLIRALEFAAILGAKNIIVHRIGVPDKVDSFGYNYNFYKGLEPYCEKFGICVAVENLFSYSDKFKTFIDDNRLRQVFAKPEYLKEMIDALHSPYFVACIDVGHSSVSGVEPENFIKAFDNKMLKALHIQDNDYLGDRHWMPYTGKLNWDNITKALAEIGYDGDFTLEVFAALRPYDDELLPEVLKLAEKIGRHLINKVEKLVQGRRTVKNQPLSD